MKTKLIRENLQKAVTIANRFVPLKPNLPVLANVFLESTKGKLTLKATNLESSVNLDLSATTQETGSITVPARIFNEFMNSAQGQDVSLSLDKENIVIESGNTRGLIATIASSEFPRLPTTESKTEGIKFTQKEIHEAISSVIFACSSDEGKPILNGIFLGKLDSKTVLVGTDGYRLAIKELREKVGFENVVIPAKTFAEAVKVAGEMEEEQVELFISEEENQLILRGGSFEVSTRLLAGTYPQFSQIIPTKFVSKLKISKGETTNAVKASAVFAKDIGNVVKLHITDKPTVSVTASTLQIGEGSSSFSATVEGDSLEVAFNSRYLLDGINSISEETIDASFSGPLSPALLRGPKDESYTYIVMPVKPQN